MPLDEHNIEACVYFHDSAKDRFFLKVSFLELGLHINSFSVQESKFEGQPKWVQPPKHRQGGNKWTATVDFDKSYPLWSVVEAKAIQAVDDYVSSSIQPQKMDTVIEVIPDEPISLDDIPF